LDTIWKPAVTVAAIVVRGDRFLLVEENTEEGALFNEPAGHLEGGESLIEGVIREMLEETAYSFVPEALVGIYRWGTTPAKHHLPAFRVLRPSDRPRSRAHA
jgi:ADP-ribose pyrophosphatase YjhB (NUDIX family)